MSNYKIFTELEEVKTNYETGKSERVAGLARSPFHIIKMVEYYTASKYMGTYIGNQKQIGEGHIDIPFNNIGNFRVALAKVATDMDIKNIQIQSDNPKHQVHSMLLNHECYEWMKESGYSVILNKKGSTRPKYGGYLQKKTMVDGKLKIDVVDWTKVFTDVSDIMGGTIAELHSMSPVALKKKDGIWEDVVEVLIAHKKIKQKDRPNKIDVYEVTGEMSNCLYNDAKGLEDSKEDEYTFSLQKYFIADVNGQKFVLYADKLDGEMRDYYRYLSWEDQSVDLGRGVWEDLEEAQVWTNDATIEENLAMKLAGRVGIKTTSQKIKGSVLEHDHGKIYPMEPGADMNSFNLAPSALGQYANIIERWRRSSDDTSSSYSAATGAQPPSNTPYAQTALLAQMANKPFEYKRQEWGIDESEIFTDWVIPYLVKKIKKQHILVSEFSDIELDQIDQAFAVENSNKDMVNQAIAHLQGQAPAPTPESQAQNIEGWKKHIKGTGKKRYLEVPDDFFAGVEPKVTVITTGEQKDKAAILTSLNTIIQTVVQSMNPQTGEFMVLRDPTLRRIFDEIVELAGSGVSPISLGLNSAKSPATTAQPAQPIIPPVTPSPMMSTPLAGAMK